MPVLKQTSPTGAGVEECAPKPRPQNKLPSARTSTAVAPDGISSGSAVSGDEPSRRSANVKPVAAITAYQWRDGTAPAWRHLRTASVLTPVRREAASAPPSRSRISSIVRAMAAAYRKEIPASRPTQAARKFLPVLRASEELWQMATAP